MRKINSLIIIPLLVASLAISGCNQKNATDTSTPVISDSAYKIPSKSEILTLLHDAAQRDRESTSKKSYTIEELYAHYEPHFTRDYVNNIVLKGSIWTQQADQWVLFEGSEPAEGSYFQDQFDEDTVIEVLEDQKMIKVTNQIGDGLYAPHQEIITLVYTDDEWKVDKVTWEPLK